MNDIDCLQRPEHYLEFDNLSGVIPLNEIDPVDQYSIDFGFELKRRVRRADNLMAKTLSNYLLDGIRSFKSIDSLSWETDIPLTRHSLHES